MISRLDRRSGTVLGFRVTGPVTKQDYAELVPQVEAVMAAQDQFSLVLDLTALTGEPPSAWGSDLALGREFRPQLRRLAVIGDSVLDRLVAALADPFYAQQARRFDDPDAAWEWAQG